MSAAQPYTILLRYELEDDREAFLRDFAGAFTIGCFRSDEAALESLSPDRAMPNAVVFITTDTERVIGSDLLNKVSAHGRFRIIISDRISLDQIIYLLDDGVADRCYTKPWDSNLVRTDLFAATMSLQNESRTTPAKEDQRSLPLVLIVDDEQSATKYLSKQLMRMQDRFDIRCAASAGDALNALHQEGDRIAVLMTDQRMPGMKGLQLINEIRQSFPYVTRILTSAYGELDVALGAVNQGRIFRYQKKPWHAATLLPVLEEAIARHKALRREAEQAQSVLTAGFLAVRERRKATLISALTETPPEAVASPQLIRRFLSDMDTISTLPPGASHSRIDNPDALDLALARGLRAELTAYLDTLPEADDADHRCLPATVQSALGVLLEASGLEPDCLVTEEFDSKITLGLQPGKSLHLYSHVLSPMTSVSSQLLKQQGALLAVYVLSERMGGTIDLRGGQQRFTLELCLPVYTASGGAPR